MTDPLARLVAAVDQHVYIDPYCPRETQPMPTVNEPGPMPLCICGGHYVHDAARAAAQAALKQSDPLEHCCKKPDDCKWGGPGSCDAYQAARGAGEPPPTTTVDHIPPPGWHSWADLVADLRARLAAVEAERDAWKNAIIDAAVCNWTYQEKHEHDPHAAVNALLAWESQIALDPTVSEPAAKLHAKINALAAALARYGRHDEGCHAVHSYIMCRECDAGYHCTCNFDRAREGT